MNLSPEATMALYKLYNYWRHSMALIESPNTEYASIRNYDAVMMDKFAEEISKYDLEILRYMHGI